jgi:hypothetical protein
VTIPDAPAGTELVPALGDEEHAKLGEALKVALGDAAITGSPAVEIAVPK